MKQVSLYSLSLAYLSTQASAHGCGSYPPARNWICSGMGAIPNLGIQWGGSNGPNVCKQENHRENINAVMVDWSSIGIMEAHGHSDKAAYQEDPRKPHIDIMKSGLSKFMPTSSDGMDAKVCSGNMVRWHALDDPMFRRDQGGFDAVPDFELREYPTKMKNGPHEFIYTCSAPHRTTGRGYVDNYITKDGVDLDKELTWADFEAEPICSYVPPSYPSPMQQTGQPSEWHHINSEKYDCIIPTDKIGDHVILRIWQRDDTGEAFYDCGDVILEPFDGVLPTPPESPSTPTPSTETESVSTETVSVSVSTPSEPTPSASTPSVATPSVQTPVPTPTYSYGSEQESSEKSCLPCCDTSNMDSNSQEVATKMSLFDDSSKIQTSDGNCLSDNGSNIQVITCNNAPAWEKFSTNQIKKVNHNLCWAIKDKKLNKLSHSLTLTKCKSDMKQAFSYDAGSGKVRAFMDDRYCASVNGDTVALEPCEGVSSADDSLRASFGV